jgi:NADH-quinone oxidoreductase subunit J
MSVLQVVFLITSALTLVAASMVVVARNLFHAALWLIVTLFGVAVVFVLLDADFLAVAQVAVYIGAIAILIIFAIMLTRGVMHTDLPQFSRHWALSLFIAIVFFAVLVFVFHQAPQFTQLPNGTVPADSLALLGQAMVDPGQFALPFELASVLLLAVMVGAIMISREKK